jgi:hypothetical protein
LRKDDQSLPPVEHFPTVPEQAPVGRPAPFGINEHLVGVPQVAAESSPFEELVAGNEPHIQAKTQQGKRVGETLVEGKHDGAAAGHDVFEAGGVPLDLEKL